MNFRKKTIRDVELNGRTILLRADYNVPVEGGQITDDYRLKKSLPTLEYLRRQNCKIIVCSHLGRPEGQVNPEFSLEPVAKRLGELLGIEVKFVPESVGDQALQAVKTMQTADVLLLENLRFHAEEEANDREFAKLLAEPGEYFVQDGFGVVHRAHASTDAITEFLPSVAGLLLENEVQHLSVAVDNPLRPLVTIIGGAKIADKIELINRFLTQANTIIVGGAMANTFLAAQGYKVGKSLYDKDGMDEAKNILKQAERAGVELVLPMEEVAVATEVSESAERRDVMLDQVGDNDIILDFGKQAAERVVSLVEHAGTVIWNGPLGMTELKQFAYSSEKLADFIAEKHINCVVGGGDTSGFIASRGLSENFTHVSTGGGASLEFLSGKKLPGIEALLDK
ncbi:MAG TPA: phosphoglycerate kinase [Candidatus Saccharimonadales bacterium]